MSDVEGRKEGGRRAPARLQIGSAVKRDTTVVRFEGQTKERLWSVMIDQLLSRRLLYRGGADHMCTQELFGVVGADFRAANYFITVEFGV